MKKGVIISHLVFNSLSIVCFILWLVWLGIYINILVSNDQNSLYALIACDILIWILTLIAIIGSAITSIFLIVGSKNSNDNHLLKIIGIIGVSSAIIGLIPEIFIPIYWLGFALLIFYIISIVGLCMMIYYYKKAKPKNKIVWESNDGLTNSYKPLDLNSTKNKSNSEKI